MTTLTITRTTVTMKIIKEKNRDYTKTLLDKKPTDKQERKRKEKKKRRIK